MANSFAPGMQPFNKRDDDEERRRREQQQAIAAANPVTPVKTSEVQQVLQNRTQPQSATQQLKYQEMPQENWFKGTQPTSSELLAQIYKIGQQDPVAGQDLFSTYNALQADPTSPIYNPYSKGSNPALKELKALGYDVADGATTEWLTQNSGLQKYLKLTSAGNIATPGKRASKEEKAAYYWYQLSKDEAQTQQAEKEWAALQEELSYWAGREDLNLSDEEILNKINWKDYKALVGMDDDRKSGNPTSLNRAVGYSQDALSGVIWAARNGVDVNDPFNSVRASLGLGKQYERNEDIQQKLDPNSPEFNPYAVTTLENAARYFGVSAFDKEWLVQNRSYMYSNDETAQKMYREVYEAEQTTLAAEQELSDLWAYVEKRLKYTTNADKIIDGLLDEYPTLQKLDRTLGGDKLLMTTRPLEFKRSAVEEKIRERCNIVNNAKHGVEFFKDLSGFLGNTIMPMVGEAATAALEARSNNIDAAGDTIGAKGTDAEKAVFEAGYDPNQEANTLGLADQLGSGAIDGQGSWAFSKSQSNQNILNSYLDAHNTQVQYEGALADKAKAEANIALLKQGIIPESLLPGSTGTKLTPVISAPEWEDTLGQYGEGNIDLYNRKPYTHENGDISTVYSMSFEEDGETILVPTIIDGQLVSEDEAIDHYHQTGEYLGKFKDPKKADEYAKKLHDQQEHLYTSPSAGRNYKTGEATAKSLLLTRDELLQFIPEDELNAAAGDPQLLQSLINKYGTVEGPDTGERGLPNQLTITQKGRAEAEAAKAEMIQKLLNIEQNNLDDANAKLEELEEPYANVKKILEDLYDGDEAAAEIAALTGANTANGYNMFAVLDRYYDIGNEYVPTQWSSYSRYDQMLKDGESPETVSRQASVDHKNILNEISEIDQILKIIDQVGGSGYANREHFSSLTKGTPDYYENVKRRRAYLQRELKAADYFQLQYNSDFAKTVDTAKDEVNAAWSNAWNRDADVFGIDSVHDGYDRLAWHAVAPEHGMNLSGGGGGTTSNMGALTQTERDTYLYLYKTEGADAAKEYYDYLTDETYGIINTRMSESIQDTFQKMGTEDWAGGVFGTVASIVSSPLKVGGALYSLYAKLSGKEINPYHAAFGLDTFTSAIRGGVKQHLTNSFGEGTAGDFLSNLAFDAFTSAGDSLVNAAMFAGLGGVVPEEAATALGRFGLKAVSSLLSAAPMGLEAASSAIQSAKIRGATDEQALMMGGMTFFCETITEAITFDNIAESYKLAQAPDAKTWKKLVTKLFTEYLDEPIAEGMNEIMEGLGDDLIMGKLSERNQRIEELKAQGMLTKDAEAIAWNEFWSDVGYAAATGFLSSQTSNVISYAAGKFHAKTTQRNVTPEQREAEVTTRGNVVEQDTSDNSVQRANERQAREAQVDENGNVVEQDTSDDSLQKAQERQAREAQVDENGNVVEPDTSDNSVQQAQEVAARQAQVDENGNVVEPDTSDNSVQQAQERQAREQQVDERGNVTEPTVDESTARAQEIADRQATVEERGNVAEPTQPVNDPARTASEIVSLTAAQNADQSSQAAVMSAVMMPSTVRDLMSTNLANAAGVALSSKYGEVAVKRLRKAIQGASRSGLSTEQIGAAFAVAAMLGEDSASGIALKKVMENGATKKNLVALIVAAAADQADPAKMSSITQGVIDHMNAVKVRNAAADGATDAVKPYEDNLANAKTEQRNAGEALEREQETQQEMQKNLETVHQDFVEDPGDKQKADAVNRATNDLKGQNAVVEESEMRKQNADASVEKAQDQLEQVQDTTLTQIREQAAAETQNELQAEAQAKAEAAAREQAEITAAAVDSAAQQAAADQVAQDQAKYNEAVQKLPPRMAFGRPIEANMENGRPVKLTGVAYSDGNDTLFTTMDGKIVSSNQLQNGNQILLPFTENWDENTWDDYEGHQAVRLEHNIPVKDSRGRSKEVTHILMADASGEGITVLFSDGTTGEWGNYTPKNRADGDMFDTVFSANEDMLGSNYNTAFDTEVESAYNVTESEGTDNAVQRGSIDQSEGTDAGQLAESSGRDVGRGDSVYAEDSSGRETVTEGAGIGSDAGTEVRGGTPGSVLSRESKANLKKNGVTDMHLQLETDQARFSTALEEGKASNDHGLFVDNQSPEELQEKGAIMILSKNGLAGAAVGTVGKDKGNIFAVFKNKRSRAKYASAGLTIQAIGQGGNKLDCYDGGLRKMYSRTGFIPVARVAFNEEFAPEGWNYERDGKPDVVFWMHNGDDTNTVASKFGLDEEDGGYHIYTPEDIQALPVFDDVTDENGETAYGYDRAWDYRDSLLEQQQSETTFENVTTEESTPEITPENVTEQAENQAEVTPPTVSKAQGTLPNANTQTGQKNQPVKSGQDIIRNLASALGIAEDSRLKKYLRGLRDHTRGYTFNDGVIHILDAQDVKAAVHEIGHNLNHWLNMESMFPDMQALRRSYESIYGPDFLRNYSTREVPGELMAEFTRTWLQDRAQAVAMAGEDIVRTFENALREHGFLDAMKQASTDFQIYDQAGAVEREKAMIKMDGPAKERKSIAQRIKEFATKFADGTLPLLELTNVVKNAQGDSFSYADDTRTLLLANPNVIGNFTESTLFGKGLVDMQGNQIINEKTGEAYGSLHDIFNKIDRKDVNDFVAYWMALNAQERAAAGKDILSEDVNAKEVVDKLGKEHPKWLGIIDEFEDWYGAFMHSWLVDGANRLSEQGFQAMRQMYPHYLPAFTVDDRTKVSGGTDGTPRTDAIPDSGLRRARGSTANKDNPIAHIAQYVQNYIANAKQVEALRAFDAQMRYVLNNQLETTAIADPAQPDIEAEYRGRANRENRQALETVLRGLRDVDHISEHDAQLIRDYLNEIPDVGYVVQDHATGYDVINIPMPDGSIHSWTVYNPGIVKALMRNSNPAQIPAFLKAAGKITRFLCANATSRSIPFVTQNFMSDTETAANTGRGGLVSKILPVYAVKQVGTAFKLLHDEIAGTAVGKALNLHESEDFRQFKLFGQLGHRYTFRSNESRADLTNKLFGGKESTVKTVGKILRSPITGIENLSEFFEDVTRYNEFLHSGDNRSTYEGRLRAGQNSREATTDFSKSGTETVDKAFMGALIPFFNANVQGVYKTARMFSSENEGNRVKTLARIGFNSIFTSAVIAAMRGIMWNDDEKEAFEQLSDYEKSRYWHIKTPSGKFFRIKRSQDGFIQIADAIGDFIGNVYTGYEDDDLGNLMGVARQVANNIMIDTGTGIAPFIDAANNKTWYGGQIENSRMQKVSETARYDEDMRTSTRLLSYLFNAVTSAVGADVKYSPLDIEYIENQYLGSMGSLGSGIFDWIAGDEHSGQELAKVFTDHLNKKFLVDPVYSNSLSTTFYDGKKRLEEMIQEGKTGKTPEYFRYDMSKDDIDKAYAEGNELLNNGVVAEAYDKIMKLWTEHDKVLEDENLTQAEREAHARDIRADINKQYITANAALADYWNKYGYSNGLEQNVMNGLNLFTGQKGKGIKSIQEAEVKQKEWASASAKSADEWIDPEYMGWANSMIEATGRATQGPHPVMAPEWDDVAYEVKPKDWNKYIETYDKAYNAYLKENGKLWDEMNQKDREKLMTSAHNSANRAARNWLQAQDDYDIPKKSK